jgi:hypothetical protein
MRWRGGGRGRSGRRTLRASFLVPLPPLSLLPLLPALVLAAGGCHHAPPPGFAPDPGLLTRIKGLLVTTSPERVCPGERIQATYEAVLDDGSTVLFERRYDSKHPPRLHVVFLRRTSPDATPLDDGDWTADRDPLLSAMSGYRLNVFLRDKPAVNKSVDVTPQYSCAPHVFTFTGPEGGLGQAGGDGPDVTVRLQVLRSPFVDRLLVASLEVGDAPPFFVLADADQIPSSDWLVIESRGGPGGRGAEGRPGREGTPGQDGCPGAAGGPGGPGGGGGPGGPGGRGGRIRVIGPEQEPFLVGMVDARSVGGPGGLGGPGGKGGVGGKGGAGVVPMGAPAGTRCDAGATGAAGVTGVAGQSGATGGPGFRPRTLTLPGQDVFAPLAPQRPELAALLEYAARHENEK